MIILMVQGVLQYQVLESESYLMNQEIKKTKKKTES